MKTKLFLICVSVAAIGTMPSFVNAAPQSDQNKKSSDSSQRETVAKPMTEKQRKKQEAKLRKELETPYKKWLNEDVAYIITDEETQGVQAAEHRRRARAVHRAVLAAARSHSGHRRERVQGRALPPHRLRQRALSLPAFPAGRPTAAGSTSCTARRTRSNRIPRAAPTSGLSKKAAAQPPPIPFEQWRYRYIEGIGNNINIEFVDHHHDRRVSHDHGSIGEGRAAVRSRRRPDHDRTDGHGRQDAALQPHRRHAPRHRHRAAAGQHERVRAPGAVRQAAEAAAGEVQGPGSGGQLEHPVQHICR